MVRPAHLLVTLLVVGAGCATAPRPTGTSAPSLLPLAAVKATSDAAPLARLPALGPEIQLASHAPQADRLVVRPVLQAVQYLPADNQLLAEPLLAETVSRGVRDELAPAGVLDVGRVIAEVVARNPSVQAMVAAWEAAAERYPQVVSLDDPMLNMNVGPGSWGNSDVASAYMIMASQKFPWPGKRQLRGAIADSEAAGAASQIEDVQLGLAELAQLAYYDYFAASRELSLNRENLVETREYRDTAEAKLRANLVTQQDVLQADVELALLERRRNELVRQVQVAAARINTLLHRRAIHPLPPPPVRLAAPDAEPSLDGLREHALRSRPDLKALGAQLQADEASLALAWKEFYPDVELYAKYDAFWQERPLRSAVGINLNVPLRASRRYAAVREAESRLRQHQGEYDRLVDEISNELKANFDRLSESRRTVRLFSDRIIPAAEQSVAAARAGYASGKVDFLRLIEAQRQLIRLREEYVEAVSDYYRRLAQLERAAAVPIEVQQSFP